MISLRLAAVCSLLLVPSLHADTPADGDASLARLGWLVGGSWSAEVKSPDGAPLKIAFTPEWGGHRKTIKYTITMHAGGKTFTQYEGVYWWDPAKKRVNMLQVDRSGNVTESFVTFDGEVFRQDNTAIKADGTAGKQRIEFRRDGEDAFVFRAEIQQGDKWQEAVKITYQRVRPGK